MFTHTSPKWPALIVGAVAISLLLVTVLPAQAPVPTPAAPTPTQPELAKKKQAEARGKEEARKKAEAEAQKRARDVEAILNSSNVAAPGDLQHFTPIPDAHKPFSGWVDVGGMWWRSGR